MIMVTSGSRVQLSACFKTEGGDRHSFLATSAGESKLDSLFTSCYPQSCVLCFMHVHGDCSQGRPLEQAGTLNLEQWATGARR